jgi:hypothetical protein
MESYKVFESGLHEVQLLSLQDPTRTRLGGDEALAAAIQRSATVLLVSHFEGFLKELAEEMVTVVTDARPAMAQLPQALKELHSLPRLEEIARCNDLQQRHVLLKRLEEVAVLWNPMARADKHKLSIRTVSRTVTSAQPEVIDLLFLNFGSVNAPCDGDLDIPDPASGDATPVNIRTRLHEIVKCRNDIAHGVADRKVTHADVDRYVAFLAALARRLCGRADMALSAIVS